MGVTFLAREAAAREGVFRIAGGGFDDSLNCLERETVGFEGAFRGFLEIGISVTSSSDISCATLFFLAVGLSLMSISSSSAGRFLLFL